MPNRSQTGRKQQMQDRAAVLAAISRIFREALGCETEEQLGLVFLDAAAELTGSKFGFICGGDQAGRFQTIASSMQSRSAAESAPLWQNWEVQGIPGRVIQTGESLICNDPVSHPDWLEPPPHYPPITSFLGVPLKLADQTFGLVVLSNRPGGYDKQHQEDMEAMAAAMAEVLRRQRAEGKLTQLRRHHELILSSSSEGILGLDLQGNMTFVNSAAAQMLGYEVEELIGRHAHAVWHHTKPDGSPFPPEECPILGAMRGGVHFPFEDDWFWRKDGTGFPVRCGKNPIIQNDQVSGAVVTFRDISARKQTETALRESEKKYRTLVETTDTGYLILDSKGKVTDANQEYIRLSGHKSLEEILGRSVVEWTAAHDRERNAGEVAKCLQQGYVRGLEIDYVDAQGRITPIEINATVITTGQSFQIVSLCRDITERKQAQEALRESEEKYRLLVNQVPAVVFRGYADWSVDFFDEKIEELTGYPKADFDSRKVKWCDLIPEEDFDYAQRVFIDALKNDKSYVREHRIRRKDGEIRWVQCRGQIFFDADEKVTHISGVTFDVTKRKETEEKLRESEETYRQLVETAFEGIWIMDAENRVTFANNRMMEMLGYSRDEVLGEPVSKFVDQEWLEKISSFIIENLREGVKEHLDVKLRHHDGRELWVIMTASPVFDKERRYAGSLGMVTDITARKQAEEGLSHAKATLEEQERFLANIFESIQDGISILDPEFNILRVNPAKERDHAYALPLMGKKCYEAFKEAKEPCPLCPVQRTLQTGQADQEVVTARLAGKEGLRHLNLLSFPLIDRASGTITGVVEYARDITEQVKAEEALRESEQRFRDISENAVEWIWEVDPEGKYTYSSPMVEKLLGYTPEEVLGKYFYDFFLPEEREELKDAVFAVFAAKQPIRDFLNRNLRKNGKTIWLSTSGVPVLDAPGNLLGYRGADNDITASKQAEEALRQSEEKFRRTFDQSPIGAAIVSLDFRFQRVNAELCRITGYSEKELLARTFMDITHPDDLKPSMKLAQRLVAGRIDHYTVEKRYLRKDGSTVWVRMSARLIKDGAGKPFCYLPMIEDITAQKRADENLRQSLDRLQKVMGEIVQAMALTVETRDPYTAGHQRRVTLLAQAIAREMGLSKEQQEAIWVAGTLHDLGKIYVPAEILSRPGELSDSELAIVKTHSQKGHDILQHIEFPWPVAQIVKQHHERLDGSGYPDGLRDKEILLEARILAVADVVEAMASHRPYRAALGIDVALEDLSRNRGTLFDPQVVDACLKVFKEKSFKFPE